MLTSKSILIYTGMICPNLLNTVQNRYTMTLTAFRYTSGITPAISIISKRVAWTRPITITVNRKLLCTRKCNVLSIKPLLFTLSPLYTKLISPRKRFLRFPVISQTYRRYPASYPLRCKVPKTYPRIPSRMYVYPLRNSPYLPHVPRYHRASRN